MLLAALEGCGIVSGLDVLEVGDAWTTLDASDASDQPDASSVMDAASGMDVSSVDVGVAPGTPGVVACGINKCTHGDVCCITQSNTPVYSCVASDCGGSSIVLHCDDPSDCDAGQCCFGNGSSQCVADAFACANLLCVNNQQCSGKKQCVAFDAGMGTKLSRCQ